MKTTRILQLATCCGILAFAIPQAQAQEVWDGDTSTNFETGTNWVSGNAPANAITATNTATFGATLPNGTTTFQPSLTASRSIGGLIFQSASGGWILGGSGFTLAIGTGGIDDSLNTSGTTTIHSNVSLGVAGQAGNQTWTTGANGNIEVTGSTILTGNRTLTVGGGTVTLASINGDGSNRTFGKMGSGTLVITGAAGSSLSGFTFNGGQLGLGHRNAMGNGTMLYHSGDVYATVDLSGINAIPNAVDYGNNSSGGAIVGDNNIEFAGTFRVSPGNPSKSVLTLTNSLTTGSELRLSGEVRLAENASASVRTLTIAGSGDTVVSGNVVNHGGTGTIGALTKSGGGTLTLSGNNTYTGATTVSVGTLLINGTHSGTGAISVDDGASFGRTGTTAIDLGGNLSFANGSVVMLSLGVGGAHSSINRTGGTWAFDSDQAFTFDDLGVETGTYAGLITGLLGTEAGLASIDDWYVTNSGWTGSFTYNSGTNSVDFQLDVIPEPSTGLLLGAALTVLALARRRRNSAAR